MAVTTESQWWIRTDGTDTNGGGFDDSITGAGTNYCDQASAQLTLTDLATSGAGVATLTSATGGFTSAMIGNCIRIVAGTNLVEGFYFITGYTDTNTVTIDRSPDDGVGGVSGASGKVGGAWGTMGSCAVNYTAYPLPSPACPVVAGNIVNVRGSGSDNPSTPDYVAPNSSYSKFQEGSPALLVEYRGYNGKPFLSGKSGQNLISYNAFHALWRNVKFAANGTGNAGNGIMSNGYFEDCYFDQAGHTVQLCLAAVAKRCWFYDSGSATGNSAYTAVTLGHTSTSSTCEGNLIDGVAAGGIKLVSSGNGRVRDNVVRNVKYDGIASHFASGRSRALIVERNVVHDCEGDGIAIVANVDSGRLPHRSLRENILIDNGGYGINVENTQLEHFHDIHQNAFKDNALGAYNNFDPASHDQGDADVALTTNPFVNKASGDYSLNNSSGGGSLLRGIVGTNIATPLASTSSYRDLGPTQAQFAGGSTGFYYLQTFENRPALPQSMGEDATSLNSMPPLISTVGNSWTTYAGAYSAEDGIARMRMKQLDATVYGTGTSKLNLQGFDPGLSDFRVTLVGHKNYSVGAVLRHDPSTSTFYMLWSASNALRWYYFNGSSFDSATYSQSTGSSRHWNMVSAELVGNVVKLYNDSKSLVHTETLTNNAGMTGQGLVGTSGDDAISPYYAIHEVGTDFNSIYPLQAVGRQPAIPHPLYLS